MTTDQTNSVSEVENLKPSPAEYTVSPAENSHPIGNQSSTFDHLPQNEPDNAFLGEFTYRPSRDLSVSE